MSWFEELYINTVGGQTLPERINADWPRTASGESLTMGKLYWANLKEMFRSAASRGRLVVSRPAEVPDEALTAARQHALESGMRGKINHSRPATHQ